MRADHARGTIEDGERRRELQTGGEIDSGPGGGGDAVPGSVALHLSRRQREEVVHGVHRMRGVARRRERHRHGQICPRGEAGRRQPPGERRRLVAQNCSRVCRQLGTGTDQMLSCRVGGPELGGDNDALPDADEGAHGQCRTDHP